MRDFDLSRATDGDLIAVDPRRARAFLDALAGSVGLDAETIMRALNTTAAKFLLDFVQWLRKNEAGDFPEYIKSIPRVYH